tara:strand:+ start:1487 stop:2164 length:678 start_codon:yes stop_codon:yes gene_type:complete
MDVENTIEASKEPMNFINYLLTLDQENKKDILNIIQYTILGIIPIILILKAVKHFVPEEDESKGNLEIILESLGQIIFMIIALWFTDRLIRYFNTYSGKEYQSFNSINFILPFLLIISTMQTKLGSKLNILVERTINLWKQNNGNTNQKNIMPPISNNEPLDKNVSLDTAKLLPSNKELTNIPEQNNPDFNNMYENTINPLQEAASPKQEEPMAANDSGTMFGSW